MQAIDSRRSELKFVLHGIKSVRRELRALGTSERDDLQRVLSRTRERLLAYRLSYHACAETYLNCTKLLEVRTPLRWQAKMLNMEVGGLTYTR